MEDNLNEHAENRDIIIENNDNKLTQITENERCESTSSSSSDYEIINDSSSHIAAAVSSPVLENINVSEDLIDDAMKSGVSNSVSQNNIVVGKSIFYDCLDEKSKLDNKTNSLDTDDGNYL
jgi:hypothetical protein